MEAQVKLSQTKRTMYALIIEVLGFGFVLAGRAFMKSMNFKR